MTEQQRNLDNGQKDTTTGLNADQDATVKRQADSMNDTDEVTLPPTSDTGEGVGEDSTYDASGAATGGGVDTPTAVDKSTEAAVEKQKPINQGSSAYTGGGADNGSNL